MLKIGKVFLAFAVLFWIPVSTLSEPPAPGAREPTTQPQTNATQDKASTTTDIPIPKASAPFKVNSETLAVPPPSKANDENGSWYSNSEWWLVIFTGLLVAVTGILAWYTSRLFRATYQLGARAKADSALASKSFQIEHRPHIGFDLGISLGKESKIIYDGISKTISFGVEANVKNFGNLPATGVRLIVKQIPIGRDIADIFTELNQQVGGDVFVGDVVFPTQNRDVGGYCSIDWRPNDFTRWGHSWHKLIIRFLDAMAISLRRKVSIFLLMLDIGLISILKTRASSIKASLYGTR